MGQNVQHYLSAAIEEAGDDAGVEVESITLVRGAMDEFSVRIRYAKEGLIEEYVLRLREQIPAQG